MACWGTTTTSNSCNQCNSTCGSRNSNGFLLIIVLYILLAIILGSCLW